ncbi:antibiotic biosynthesis monooxygenase family protein [Micromonospora sp. CPCC 206061]|uniref:antibiotic biosynthesis monooxygenase family protein n=1 Tax=Micromonospora sp. CPCC 206061 TaxID=3122410 RepID=UPI002FF397D2
MTAKLIANLHVRDYDTFKSVFDELQTARQEHGAIGHRLHRGLDDPNKVIVVTEYRDADDARRFVQSTELKEAQQRAGVDAPGDFSLCEEIEARAY